MPKELNTCLLRWGTRAARHSHSTLWSHLQGVARLLAAWNCDQRAQTVGLAHSVYRGLSLRVLELRRRRLKAVLGEDLESAVNAYNFKDQTRFVEALERGAGNTESCVVLGVGPDFEVLTIAPQDLQRFVDVTLANALEQAGRLPELYSLDHLGSLEGMSRFASRDAAIAIAAARSSAGIIA